MSGLMNLFGAFYQVTGLAFVLLAIPLAFDVGGAECGLSFAFLLSLFYFSMSTLRLTFRKTFLRPIASMLYYTQFLVLPSILLLHLSQCPNNSTWLLNIMWPWKTALNYATGTFTILEGFCTLIIVQACGRACASMARKSDTFLLVQLALASLAISADIYLLIRIYMLPDMVGLASATLIGAALSACLSLGVYGIWSRRGNVVESTLLFSYVVYQIYLTFTDFQTSNALNWSGVSTTVPRNSGSVPSMIADFKDPRPFWSIFSPFVSADKVDPVRPRQFLREAELPPVIIDNVAQFMTLIAELTPAGIKTMLDFLMAASSSITPSIFVSLTWRLCSYLSAMRLVPYIRRQTPRFNHTHLPVRRRFSPSKLVMLGYAYSPVLIVMVYTHLLLLHAGHVVHRYEDGFNSTLPFDWTKIWTNSRHAWKFWGWINIFVLLGVYAAELPMSPAENPPGTPVDVNDNVIEIN